MNKLYYGLWQDLYTLSWPARLCIELAIVIFLVYLIIQVLIKVFRMLKLKKVLVKLVVLLVTKVLSCVGKDREWAYQADEKIVDWGNTRIKTPVFSYCRVKMAIGVCVCLLYFLAILPDIPIHNYLDDSLVDNISVVKKGFQTWEGKISSGYTNYQPIFSVMDKEKIVIRMNEKVKKSVKLYEKPSLKSKVIEKISKKEILYRNQYKKTGEKYWLKVYLSDKSIEGWIIGDAINKDQLKKIVYK